MRGAERPHRVVAVLGLPVLGGLFGITVGLGTVGRLWAGPATLLSHLDDWGTAAVAAISAVLVNNLPAASLLGLPAAAPLCAIGRTQPGPESVCDRFAGLVSVVARRPLLRSEPIARQGHPPRSHGSRPCHGGRRGDPDGNRFCAIGPQASGW